MLKQTRKRNFINVQLDLRKRLRGGGQKTDGDEGTLDDFEQLQDWRADNGTCMASVIPYIWQALAPKQDGSALLRRSSSLEAKWRRKSFRVRLPSRNYPSNCTRFR